MSVRESLDDERYLRQLVLAQIGEEGQRLLWGAEARVAEGGLTEYVARRYLEGAGVARVEATAEGARGPGEEESFVARDDAAANVLAGARVAQRELVRILGAERVSRR